MNMQFTLALRYLAGRKLRTFLTTLAIVFGVLVIFGMNSLLPVFVQAFQANAMAAASQVDATITSQTGEPFPQSVLDKVSSVSGVRAASGSFERTIGLPADYFDHDPKTPDKVSAVNLVGIQPDQARAIQVYQVLSGRFLQPGDTNGAVIAASLADAAN
ncbi:MAG TPA: ABC transporter permease, partial [Anaerolineaceae bacterium]